MTFPGGGGFEDLFGAFPGSSGPKSFIKKPEPKVQKGLPWRAKVIEGQFYIPLEQVAELLEQNGVLDKVSEGIRRRVEQGPE